MNRLYKRIALELSLTTIFVLSFAWLTTLKLAAILSVGLLAHELGHAYSMQSRGLGVKYVRFLPLIGGITSSKKGSQSKRQLGVIAIAGPIYGFLATIGIGLWGIHINDLSYVAGAIVFGLVNASNLLPLYQLDGGSVLSCITFSINKWVGLIVMGSIQLAVIVVSCKYSFYILAFVAGLGLGQVVRQFRFNKNKGDLNPRGVKSLTVIYLATIVAHVLLMYYLLGVDGSRDAVTAILGERLKNI